MATVMPTVSLSGYSGFYGGAELYVSPNSNYPYIYVGNALSGTYWLKESSGTSISIDADTTSTSKTIYVFRSDTNLGLSCNQKMTTSTATKYDVPRFACRIYYCSSTATICSWSTTDGYLYPSEYVEEVPSDIGVVFGFTTKEDWVDIETTMEYGQLYNSQGPAFNGTTLYTLALSSNTIKYYIGSDTPYETHYNKYWYGRGYTTTSIDDGEPMHRCESDNSYSFQGWATSKTTSHSYSTLYALASDGYTKAYGVYKKDAYTLTSSVYYYGGNDVEQPVTKIATTSASYYYGTGDKYDGTTTYSYGTITTSCLSDSSYSLVGWTSDSSSTTIEYTDAEDAFNSYSTIYGVYKKTESMIYQPKNGDVSNSVSVTNYIYGTGLATSNIPTEPSLTYEGYEFEGWSSSNTNEVADTWENQWNDGIRTVYAVWTRIGSIYFGTGDSWVEAYTYKGTIVDGVLTWVSISVDDLMKYVN